MHSPLLQKGSPPKTFDPGSDNGTVTVAVVAAAARNVAAVAAAKIRAWGNQADAALALMEES
jgi:hypothetical protein